MRNSEGTEKNMEIPLHFVIFGSVPDLLFAASAVVATILEATAPLELDFLIVWHFVGFFVFLAPRVPRGNAAHPRCRPCASGVHPFRSGGAASSASAPGYRYCSVRSRMPSRNRVAPAITPLARGKPGRTRSRHSWRLVSSGKELNQRKDMC